MASNPFSIRNDNPFSLEREEREPHPGEDRLGTTGTTASISFANAIMGAPKILGLGSAALGALGSAEGGFIKGFKQRMEREKTKAPASGFYALGSGDINDVGAAIHAFPKLFPGGESFGEAFDREKMQFEDLEAGMREAAPIRAFLGDIIGEGAAIAMGRAPTQGGVRAIERSWMNPQSKTVTPRSGLQGLPDEVINLARSVWESPVVRKLGRAVYRTTETSAEAAMLDIAKGDDELTTVPFAAAAQLGGSASLEIARHIYGGSVSNAARNAMAYAFMLAAGHSIIERLAPGEAERFITEIDQSYDHIALATVLGATFGVAGMGRVDTTRAPQIADWLSSAQRGSVISMLQKLANSSQDVQDGAVDLSMEILKNPGSFSDQELKELIKSYEDGSITELLDVE